MLRHITGILPMPVEKAPLMYNPAMHSVFHEIAGVVARRLIVCACMSVQLLACGGNPRSGPGVVQGTVWSAPVTSAQQAFQLAATGDWNRFEQDAAMPCDLMAQMAAGQPLPWGLRPEQVCAVNRSELRQGFERVQRQAAGPVVIRAGHVDGTVSGAEVHKLSGGYLTRQGTEESIQFKLVWYRGRFFVTGM